LNSYSTAKDVVESLNGIVAVGPGQLKVLDEKRFRSEAVDRLVYSAVFGSDEVKAAARWLIWEAGQQLGVMPASIQGLYDARGRGKVGGFTVPAMNLRGLTYHMARAAVRAALQHNVGAFVFEIARSEMGYTEQKPEEYTTALLGAALREGFQGALFVQGDHFQISRKGWEKDPEGQIAGLKKLIEEAVAGGFYNIDIDSSTTVDLSQPTVDTQQHSNYAAAAELTAYVRSKEPNGVTISVGGEIGEVGGKNSTPEELEAYMNGFLRELQQKGAGLKGISKISIQTGTEHGGVVLPDGTIADVSLDFNVLKSLSHVAREKYGMAGAVQHGASTLPDSAFHKFVEADCCEVHLATAFQNMTFESQHFPAGLRDEMYDFARANFQDEKKEGQTDEQFIYKTRKKLYGPFKKQAWDMEPDLLAALGREWEEKFAFYYQQLAVVNSRDMVNRYVKPARIERPRPQALEEVARSAR
jgi:fructose/tagatose bisphosphate aldolase